MLKEVVLLVVAVMYTSYALPTHPDTLKTPTFVAALQGINNYYKRKGDTKTRTPVELMSGYHELKLSTYVQSIFTIRVTTGTYVEDCSVEIRIPIKSPHPSPVFQGNPSCTKVAST